MDAWKLHPGWDKDGCNIRWAEIIAIELGLLFAICHGYSDTNFLVKSDNQGIIQAIEGGKSRSPEQNLVLQQILYCFLNTGYGFPPSTSHL